MEYLNHMEGKVQKHLHHKNRNKMRGNTLPINSKEVSWYIIDTFKSRSC